MSATNYILPLEKAKYYADGFISKIVDSYDKISVTGQLRRECAECNYVELIATPKMAQGMVTYFDENRPQTYSMLDVSLLDIKNLEQDGKKRKIFHYPEHRLKVVFYISNNENWGKDLCWTTGNNEFYRTHIAVAWNRQGWCVVDGELRRKKECEHYPSGKWGLKDLYENNFTKTPAFDTEKDLFKFLELDYVEPSKRNW